MKNNVLIILLFSVFTACGNYEKVLQPAAWDAYNNDVIQKQGISFSGNCFVISADTVFPTDIFTEGEVFHPVSRADFISRVNFDGKFQGGETYILKADTVIKDPLFTNNTVMQLRKSLYQNNYPIIRGDDLLIRQKDKGKLHVAEIKNKQPVRIQLCDISFVIAGKLNSYTNMYPLQYMVEHSDLLYGGATGSDGEIKIHYNSLWKISEEKQEDRYILQNGGLEVKYTKDFNLYISLLKVAQKAADDFASLLVFEP